MTQTNKLLSATRWSFADVLLRQGIQLGVSVALARTLQPEAFGLFALVMAVTSFAGVFVDSGMGAALVQRRNLTQIDESTVFWFNLAVAGALGGLLVLCSTVIATVFRAPEAAPIVAASASVLLINALSAVHVARLSRASNFKVQAQAGAVAILISGVIAIYMAKAGYGVWSLVGQTVSSAMVTTTLYWVMSPWRPSLRISATSFHAMFGFGGYMLLTILLETIATRVSSAIIGTLYSARDLGYYVRGEATSLLPSSLLQRVVSRVAFSSYAEVSHDLEVLRRNARNALNNVVLINTPIVVGLAAAAKPFILTLYGARWEPAIPYLQILALAGLATPYHVVNLSAIMSLGLSKMMFWMHLAKKVIAVGLVVLVASLGPLAIAWAVLAGSLVTLVFDAVFPGRVLGYSVFAQARDAAPVLLASAVMGLLVVVFIEIATLSPALTLGASVALGATTYGAMVIVLRVPAARSLWAQALASKLARRLWGTRA